MIVSGDGNKGMELVTNQGREFEVCKNININMRNHEFTVVCSQNKTKTKRQAVRLD